MTTRSAGPGHLCSWEVPYDFTPSIHPYRGITSGVVRKAWEGEEGVGGSNKPPGRRIDWTAPRLKIRRNTKQKVPLGGNKAPPADPPINAHQPTQPQQQRQRPPVKPPPPLPGQERRRPHSGPRVYTSDDLAALSTTANNTNNGSTEASNHKVAPPRTTTTTAADTATQHHHHHRGYRPRTCLTYTLPPRHAQHYRSLQASRSPSVAYRDGHRTRHGGPPPLHTVLLPQQGAQGLTTHTRAVLAAAMRAVEMAPPPIDIVELLLSPDSAHGAATAGGGSVHYNYNTNAFDVCGALYDARLAALAAAEAKVYGRLIASVAPLSEALAAAANDDRGGGAAVALVDSGHFGDPIFIATAAEAANTAASATAVTVRPIACEVGQQEEGWVTPHPPPPASLPRGREWDRQRAIAAAVGPTARDAIIDLDLDPRYRQPGEYVRWAHRGGRRVALK